MTLGESINYYRKNKGLSQAQLSEMLSVSRQSVSKWETDTAVPEIDKLIGLSEIFEISLDELIKGEAQKKRDSNKADSVGGSFVEQDRIKSPPPHFPARKITGTILLCFAFLTFLVFAFLGGVLSGILFSMPFLLCGIVCFIFRKNIGLWCCWAVYFAVDMYLGYGTALNRSNIFHTFSWTYEMNYAILVLSWISFLILVALWGATVYKKRESDGTLKKNGLRAVTFFGIIIACRVANHLLIKLYMKKQLELYGNLRDTLAICRFCMFIVEWISIAAFTALSVYILRIIILAVRRKKEAKINL